MSTSSQNLSVVLKKIKYNSINFTNISLRKSINSKKNFEWMTIINTDNYFFELIQKNYMNNLKKIIINYPARRTNEK